MLPQVTAEVQPRLAAQVNTAVSIDRTRMVNIIFSHHFCSWCIWQSIFHTPVVEEAAGPRDICQQYSQPYFQTVSCNSSSSVFLNQYRTLCTKQRRGSKASGFRKHCHEGSTTSSHVVTPLVYGCCSTCSSKLYLYFSWNPHILRLSEIRPIPWFLTEVEVLVDPSTWTNLSKVEPATNDRDYPVSYTHLTLPTIYSV